MAKAKGKFINLKSVASRLVSQATKYSPDLLPKFSNPELAAAIAGTADKKSKEYKAALRTVQRYKQGTRGAKKPSKATTDKIQTAVRKLVKRDPKIADKVIGMMKVTIAAQMQYSSEIRNRTVSVYFESDEAGDFLGLARENDLEGAEEYFFDKYDTPGMFLVDQAAAVVTLETLDDAE